MIGSPAQHIETIKSPSLASLAQRQRFSDEEITQQARDMVHGTSIITYFVRLSWVRKVRLLTDLFKRVKSICTLNILLNTLYSATGKIPAYFVTTTAPSINYDTMLMDHDRMLDETILETTLEADLNWFQNISDKDQVAYLISLLRLSGGAMVRTLYKKLQTVHAQRLHALNLAGETISEKKEEGQSEDEFFVSTHDPNDPKHQKCLALEEQWNRTIKKFRKRVQKMEPKEKKQKAGKKKKSKKGSSAKKSGKKKGKKSKKSKKNRGKKVSQIDWVQLMPIWIVKKIFGYLDKKTLKKAQKVNEYWKWAIGELQKDRKVRKVLDKANAKLKEKAGGNCNLPDENTFKSPKPRVSFTARRLAKLQRRGAITEELRHITQGELETGCLLMRALKLSSEYVPYLDEVTIFPRIANTKPPSNQKPEYIVKDLGIICKEIDDAATDSGDTSIRSCASSDLSDTSTVHRLSNRTNDLL